MLKIRRSRHHLIFNMGIPYMGKKVFILKRALNIPRKLSIPWRQMPWLLPSLGQQQTWYEHAEYPSPCFHYLYHLSHSFHYLYQMPWLLPSSGQQQTWYEHAEYPSPCFYYLYHLSHSFHYLYHLSHSFHCLTTRVLISTICAIWVIVSTILNHLSHSFHDLHHLSHSFNYLYYLRIPCFHTLCHLSHSFHYLYHLSS